MKKAVLFLIMFFAISVSPSYSHTLKGEVTYTVERARKEAFTNVEYSLPQSIIDKNIKDPNFKENIKAIKLGATELKDRYVGKFSNGEYIVVYKNNLSYEYYYNFKGNLVNVGKRVSLKMPTKCYKYDTNGRLVIIILYVTEKYSFAFFPNGKLSSYWVNNVCYDANGNVVGHSF